MSSVEWFENSLNGACTPVSAGDAREARLLAYSSVLRTVSARASPVPGLEPRYLETVCQGRGTPLRSRLLQAHGRGLRHGSHPGRPQLAGRGALSPPPDLLHRHRRQPRPGRGLVRQAYGASRCCPDALRQCAGPLRRHRRRGRRGDDNRHELRRLRPTRA